VVVGELKGVVVVSVVVTGMTTVVDSRDTVVEERTVVTVEGLGVCSKLFTPGQGRKEQVGDAVKTVAEDVL